MNEIFDSAKPKAAWRHAPRAFGLALGSAAVLGIAVVYAAATAFSYFATYDDEGYAMLGVRGFLEGHPLYRDVFSYYGPFYFLYEWLVHSVLAVPLTHDATTALCVVHWMVGSSVLALAGFLLTRSLLIACLVFMQLTLHLTPLAREPGHPQEVGFLLLCAAIVLSARAAPARRLLPALAAIGAALIFTKINVGVFFICALGLALASRASFFKARPAWFVGTLVLAGLLPFLLMRPNLREGWALLFSAQSCAAILAAGLVAYVFAGEEDIRWVPLLRGVCVFTAFSAVLVLVILFSGTPFSSLFESMVTLPATLGNSFSIPLRVPYAWLSATFALVSAGLVIRFREQTKLRWFIAAAKAAFGLFGILVMVTDYNRELGFFLPWSWLLLVQVPPDKASRATSFGRTFLCLLAIWESLQAYPVAGTQAMIGTLCLPLVYGVCLYDAFRTLTSAPPAQLWLSRLAPQSRALLGTLAFAALLCLFATQWCRPLAAWRYYQSVAPLALNGAKYLRLPDEQGQLYRALTSYLQNQDEPFFTLPGFNSLYFWAGKAPPTYLNNAERLVLSESQQQRVIAALQKAKRPLIVLDLSAAPIPERAGPLAVLLHQRCREIARFASFQVLEVPVSPLAQSRGEAEAQKQRSPGPSQN